MDAHKRGVERQHDSQLQMLMSRGPCIDSVKGSLRGECVRHSIFGGRVRGSPGWCKVNLGVSCQIVGGGSRDKERNLGTEPPRSNGCVRGAACVVRPPKVHQVKKATSSVQRMAASANIPRNTFASSTGWFLLRAQHVETRQRPLFHVWARSRELGRTRRSFQGSR